MDIKQLKKHLKLDKRKETAEESLRWAIASYITNARIASGLTQEKLAKKIGTKQSGVARWENASSFPSLRTLCNIVRATKCQLTIRVKPTPPKPN